MASRSFQEFRLVLISRFADLLPPLVSPDSPPPISGFELAKIPSSFVLASGSRFYGCDLDGDGSDRDGGCTGAMLQIRNSFVNSNSCFFPMAGSELRNRGIFPGGIILNSMRGFSSSAADSGRNPGADSDTEDSPGNTAGTDPGAGSGSLDGQENTADNSTGDTNPGADSGSQDGQENISDYSSGGVKPRNASTYPQGSLLNFTRCFSTSGSGSGGGAGNDDEGEDAERYLKFLKILVDLCNNGVMEPDMLKFHPVKLELQHQWYKIHELRQKVKSASLEANANQEQIARDRMLLRAEMRKVTEFLGILNRIKEELESGGILRSACGPICALDGTSGTICKFCDASILQALQEMAVAAKPVTDVVSPSRKTPVEQMNLAIRRLDKLWTLLRKYYPIVAGAVAYYHMGCTPSELCDLLHIRHIQNAEKHKKEVTEYRNNKQKKGSSAPGLKGLLDGSAPDKQESSQKDVSVQVGRKNGSAPDQKEPSEKVESVQGGSIQQGGSVSGGKPCWAFWRK